MTDHIHTQKRLDELVDAHYSLAVRMERAQSHLNQIESLKESLRNLPGYFPELREKYTGDIKRHQKAVDKILQAHIISLDAIKSIIKSINTNTTQL